MALALFLSATPSAAQSVSASLVGLVSDPAGRPVADAVVTARHQRTAALRQSVTGADGRYVIHLLRPGRYTLQVQAVGFVAAVREDVTLPLQGTVTVDVPLSPSVVEEVTVTGEAPLLDPAETGGGLVVGSREIAQLPLAGRVFTDLALLDASLRPAAPGTFVGERSAVFSANGQGGRANSFLVDGLDNNDQTLGSRTSSLFSQQVVQEFRVMTDGYAPEFGRASGGVLNILTRSGGNTLDGRLFLQGTLDSLGETGSFVDPLPREPSDVERTERRQWGGLISGPLRRDRAFYLVAYEQGDSNEVVPFTGVSGDQFASSDPAAGHRVDAGGRLEADNLTRNAFTKLNVLAGANRHLEIRLSWDDARVRGVNVGGRRTPDAGHGIDQDTVQLAASLTSALGPRWFHEVRLLAARSDVDQRANSGAPGVERPWGVYGGNDLQRQERAETRLQLLNNVSWFRGSHSVKFGLDVQDVSADIGTAFNEWGVFAYRAQYDPIAFVYRLIRGKPSDTFDTTLVAAFVQDQYRVTPSFRLTYGLRYDLDTFGLDDRYAIRFPRGRGGPLPPNGGAARDTDNIAPRVAFTWTPARSLLVRGGVGVFYDKVVLGFPAVSSITGQQKLGIIPLQAFNMPLNEDNIRDVDRRLLLDALLDDPRFNLFFTTGDTLDTPYTVQSNLGLDLRVAPATLFSANLVRARGYHQPLYRDINPVVSFRFFDNDPDRRFPFHRVEEVGSIASLETVGNSWYDALELALERREGPVRFRASYVISRAEDEGSDPLRGGISLPFDSDDIPGERARSDNDQRHRLVVSGTWETPFWGLVISPVVQYASGIPFNVTVSDDSNGDGLLENDRPCASLDENLPCTGSNVKWRLRRNTGEDTPLKLVNRIRREAGLPPVDDLEEPDFFQVDVRIARRFQVGRATLDGFLQVFNVFDRENGGPVDGRVDSLTFGEPVGLLGPPRTAEVGLRLEF